MKNLKAFKTLLLCSDFDIFEEMYLSIYDEAHANSELKLYDVIVGIFI